MTMPTLSPETPEDQRSASSPGFVRASRRSPPRLKPPTPDERLVNDLIDDAHRRGDDATVDCLLRLKLAAARWEDSQAVSGHGSRPR